MEKLISMTDFVLQQSYNGNNKEDYVIEHEVIYKYAKFLKQPLTLGMFVPVDENGNILEEPKVPDYDERWHDLAQDSQVYANYQYELDMFEKAKEKVLFEGFEIHVLLDEKTKRLTSYNSLFSVAWYNEEKGWYLSNGVSKMTVEHLLEYHLELTSSALKQMGL